jgi:phosphate transport system permease protein
VSGPHSALLDPPPPSPARAPHQRRRTPRVGASLLARGTPQVWLTAGGLAVCLAMVAGLLTLVVLQGLATFWPAPLERVRLQDGKLLLGEVARRETPPADDYNTAPSPRELLRVGNFELTGEHYAWVDERSVVERDRPEWALGIERLTRGRFHGMSTRFLIDGAVAADTPEGAWRLFEQHHGDVRERWHVRRALETGQMGRVHEERERARLAVREAELEHGEASPQAAAARTALESTQAAADAEYERLRAEIAELDRENARYALGLETADGTAVEMPLDQIVRAWPANRMGVLASLGLYLERWGEFLLDEPREANSEGGVYPAIFGTVVMTLLMTVLVVPIGVLAALYLREYARAGMLSSWVRIAINNLAGVPSIVFGVFGLGFFCYLLGGGLDRWLFAAKLPTPTFGTGGVLWASLTLALLTLPVVIVATEEALAAVPNSMREGSYACGASKWQTIRRIVLPRAMPGITTGMILAIARGAGEVAPLMLVGAVKVAPALPLDGTFPFVHPERSFMHLGFHIYDLGFQSQNSEAAKPMVFTTTLLLIAIVVTLNLAAIWMRGRLQRRFRGTHI